MHRAASRLMNQAAAPHMHMAHGGTMRALAGIQAAKFGTSMLTETLNIDTDQNADGVQQMSLIEAFANPLGYLAQRAGSIVAGSVSQVANGIDEFVTGALRNNRRHVKTL